MKKTTREISLGIALTETYVEAAQVELCGKELTLLRGGRLALPAGVIQKGRIRDPKQLGTAVRRLLRREGIRQRDATVCVMDRCVLTQILELPRNLPSNLHQHIRSEIRHSPLLTGREPVYDFIRLGEGESESSRLFVGATDRERLEEIFQAFHAVGLRAAAIEIGPAAVLRALQRNLLKLYFDRNLLVADLTGGTLTICVLIKEQVDFIRRTVLGADADPERAMLSELGAIRQFYEIEKELFFDANWMGIFVSDEPVEAAADRKEALEQALGMEVYCGGGAGLLKDLGIKTPARGAAVCACAAGLAMRPFERGKYIGGLDFLPERVRQFYQLKKLAKGTLGACAAVVAVMFLLSVLSSVRIERLSSAHAAGTASATPPVTEFVENKRKLETQLSVYRKESKQLEKIVAAAPKQKWSGLLEEIRKRIPQRLWISIIEVDESGSLTIQGQALSHSSIYQFADLLERSDLVTEAQVSDSRISGDSTLLLEYRIVCRQEGTQKGTVEE